MPIGEWHHHPLEPWPGVDLLEERGSGHGGVEEESAVEKRSIGISI